MSAVLATNKNIPDDMLLGNLLFYTLKNLKISETELASIFTSAGVDKKFIRSISAADAFRRATSSVKNKQMMFGSEVRRLEVNEVVSDNERIIRVIGCKKVDENGKEISEKVSYDAVAELIYDRSVNAVSYNLKSTLTPAAKADLSSICQDLITMFVDNSSYHNNDTIRNIFIRILDSCHPISLMPTGVCKFIPKVNKDVLYQLKEVVESLDPYHTGEKSVMEIIPIIDTQDQRDLVDKCFRAELGEEIVHTINELGSIIAAKSTLPTKTINAYTEKCRHYVDKANQYSSLLENGAEILLKQIDVITEMINNNKESEI